MKRVTLANGDKVELFYSFRTSKEMVGMKDDIKKMEEIKEKYGEDIDFMDLDSEEIDDYMDSISKIVCAVLNGSKYPCDIEEVDFLINEDIIKAAVDVLEEQKQKEESVAKKKDYVSKKKK